MKKYLLLSLMVAISSSSFAERSIMYPASFHTCYYSQILLKKTFDDKDICELIASNDSIKRIIESCITDPQDYLEVLDIISSVNSTSKDYCLSDKSFSFSDGKIVSVSVMPIDDQEHLSEPNLEVYDKEREGDYLETDGVL